MGARVVARSSGASASSSAPHPTTTSRASIAPLLCCNSCTRRIFPPPSRMCLSHGDSVAWPSPAQTSFPQHVDHESDPDVGATASYVIPRSGATRNLHSRRQTACQERQIPRPGRSPRMTFPAIEAAVLAPSSTTALRLSTCTLLILRTVLAGSATAPRRRWSSVHG